MRRLGAVVVVGSVVLLAGCAAESSQFVGVTASPSASASVTASPSPSPSSEVEDLSDADLGIVFEDVPTDLTGDEADVYNTVATYQVEYWRTMTTNVASLAFDVLASVDIQAVMERIATNNEADDVSIAGVFRTRVHDVEVEGDLATAAVCDFYQDVTFQDADGPDTPETAGFGEPRSETLTLQRIEDGVWVIGLSESEGTC
ncbi:hypothetical protein [Cellulomonas sp. SLBN-39]|uniref:hypothetical protein n=1 Tax=Cellulomonas sp. SLBN-39 TaxID=2768446 RepID=UPI00114EDA71|nr:hypothetical protein [Cellulomonas sp. SLBN-39]TQL01854.1 hypothetical protein FBY24_0914 [Cellulomonas sp. SLBN-39]